MPNFATLNIRQMKITKQYLKLLYNFFPKVVVLYTCVI